MIIVSREELAQLIAENMEQALLKFRKEEEERNDTGSRYMNTREAAKYLRLKNTKSLSQVVARGDLPARKRGQRLYFLREDLDAYLESGKVN